MWQFIVGIFLGTAGGVAIMCILIAGADKSGTVEREEQKDEEKNVK